MGICSYKVLINMGFYVSKVKVSADKQLLRYITGQILHISFLTKTAHTFWILSWSLIAVSTVQILISVDILLNMLSRFCPCYKAC